MLWKFLFHIFSPAFGGGEYVKPTLYTTIFPFAEKEFLQTEL